MIPAVIYARFSSHSQTEQSIEGQLAACYDFAEREGYAVIGEYIDRAISARTDDRPDFQRMIADSAKHTFEVILVYQLDRFSRNRYDSAVNKQKLKKNGVRVVSARENITADASGVLMEAVLEGMAEYYSAELAQKIRRGMDMSGSKCLATGGRPALGYKVDETKHYQIDENTAPTVVKIFEMYASGMTVAQIITELNQQNIKTSTDADFNKNSLRKMLTNKRYIGIYTYKGTETPGGIPRIVSDELFNRVAEMMEKNKKAPARARAKEEYLLTTKLFCGHCREMMTGISGTSKTGTIHNYYTCNGRKKKLCSKKNVQKEYIEDRVIALARAQLTDENISKISKAVAALCEREKESSEYRRLERQRCDIEKQKANLVDALKYGKATETLLNEIAKLESGIEGIDRQILMEKAKCLDLKEPEIAFFLTKLRDGDINDITYRRAIIAVMVNAVYLYDDGRLTVIFNSSDRPVEVTESLLADVEEDAAEFVSGVCRSTKNKEAHESVPLYFWWGYFIRPSPAMRAVISSMRSSGNGGSHRGLMAMDMSFMGLSSAATRLELSVPQRLQRWMIAHSPPLRTQTATGSMMPPQSAARSPGSMSTCRLERQLGQWLRWSLPAFRGVQSRPQTLQVKVSLQGWVL